MADGDETGERERRAAANNVALYYFQGQHMTFLCLFASTPVSEALFHLFTLTISLFLDLNDGYAPL